ncbi:MAG: c-type cytochrome [Candidatus Acidiferrum sp.]
MIRIQNLGFEMRPRVLSRSSIATPALTVSLGFFLVLFFGHLPSARAQGVAKQGVPSSTQARSGQWSSVPTGAERCVFCHPTEVQGFARSAMAHALRRAGQEPEGTVSAHGSTITMHSAPAGFWQSWENSGDKSDYRVDFVIGSGEHASGFLVEIGGHLFQSPIAYYKSRQSYDLAPGYENQPDPDFTRPVSEECVLCHSGISLHVPGTLNQYRPPVFAAEAITCERCHGPSETHLANPNAGTIVNPGKLPIAARDSICEQCHLFGVARVPNPGKKLSDFVPGQVLEDTYTIYRNAAPGGSAAGDFKVISHVEQLALSSCARNSGGRLWCATCHNPHEKMSESIEYYRSRCVSCHTTTFPASHPTKDSDCLGCHMPRRDAKDGGHTAFTDHRIQRRPETRSDLPSNVGISAWREPAAELQKRNLGIAYIDVGMQRHSSAFVIQGYRDLTEVQEKFAEDSDFFKWIGEALLLAKQTTDAKFAFERALLLDPHSALTEASAAAPYIQEGDNTQAIAHLQRAVTLDPLFLPAASTLIGLYEKEGKPTEAAALSAKIKTAMEEQTVAGHTTKEASTSESQKNTEDVFKNIKVLKGIPSEQLIPAMEFMASSLGVECSFCHVEGHFEKDDKKTKKTAREMMQMMFAVNTSTFDNRRVVTCYSCHRGSPKPVATPLMDTEMNSKPDFSNPSTQALSTNLPTADQLIDRYVHALGGAAAIEKIASREEKGLTNVSGKLERVEFFTQSPDKQALVRHLPEGDSVIAFDGHAGWLGIPGRPVREMHAAGVEAARMDADLKFPLHIRDLFPDLRVDYPEKVGSRDADVLFCFRDKRLAAKLYFDQQSGLLLRFKRFDDSPLGSNPSEIDYADYRDVDGVQVPFRLMISRPEINSTIQFSEVRQNVAIDAAKFAKPQSNGSQ